jgi:deoxyribodipyrimidine photolyase-related protein
LNDLDHAVIADLPSGTFGADPTGLWATDRSGALRRLDHFITNLLPRFGPHEDAMTERSWHLAHSMLSPYLNLGLILPGEVCDRVEAAYRSGTVPLASAEGFIRQIIGWREYVWGIYWLWPEMNEGNALANRAPVPPAFLGEPTDMRCLAETVRGIGDRGWNHHIQRLMVLTNLANLLGVEPGAMTDWMMSSYVDAAEWVMVPNVFGMGMWADGGRMATKPYVSGGAYIDRMSDHCGSCRFDPTQRSGPEACPFSSLYWDFLARHRTLLHSSARMGMVLSGLDRLPDLEETRRRADEVRVALLEGSL